MCETKSSPDLLLDFRVWAAGTVARRSGDGSCGAGVERIAEHHGNGRGRVGALRVWRDRRDGRIVCGDRDFACAACSRHEWQRTVCRCVDARRDDFDDEFELHELSGIWSCAEADGDFVSDGGSLSRLSSETIARLRLRWAASDCGRFFARRSGEPNWRSIRTIGRMRFALRIARDWSRY